MVKLGCFIPPEFMAQFLKQLEKLMWHFLILIGIPGGDNLTGSAHMAD